jgi:hypothetical protein
MSTGPCFPGHAFPHPRHPGRGNALLVAVIPRTTVELEPGPHNYRFLVDGQWRDYPECTLQVPNPFGGQDSVRQDASFFATSPGQQVAERRIVNFCVVTAVHGQARNEKDLVHPSPREFVQQGLRGPPVKAVAGLDG